MTSKVLIDRDALLAAANRLSDRGQTQVAAPLWAALAAPEAPWQDNSALMKIAADLTNRKPLRQLYLVFDTQSRIGAESLHEYLDKCGDQLAGIALDIRRAITSSVAPLSPDHSGGGAEMVLPSRCEIPKPQSNLSDMSMFDYDEGWNACLDKVKELN